MGGGFGAERRVHASGTAGLEQSLEGGTRVYGAPQTERAACEGPEGRDEHGGEMSHGLSCRTERAVLAFHNYSRYVILFVFRLKVIRPII